MNKHINKESFTFWNKFNKRVLAFGVVPALVIILHVAFGSKVLGELVPKINFLVTIVLGAIAALAAQMSLTYLIMAYFLADADDR